MHLFWFPQSTSSGNEARTKRGCAFESVTRRKYNPGLRCKALAGQAEDHHLRARSIALLLRKGISKGFCGTRGIQRSDSIKGDDADSLAWHAALRGAR
jgi:hypothetical protein